MSRESRELIILIVVMLCCIIGGVGNYFLESYKCGNFARISAYASSEYSLINGCFVEIDGRMVNVELLRKVIK